METSGVNAVEAGDYEIKKDGESGVSARRGAQTERGRFYTRSSNNTASGTQVNALCSCDRRTLRMPAVKVKGVTGISVRFADAIPALIACYVPQTVTDDLRDTGGLWKLLSRRLFADIIALTIGSLL
jgi:hypothetical protein